MKLKAADRMKALRMLVGMTREQFADYLGVQANRYRTVEVKRARMAEDEFERVCSNFPEFMAWITIEGQIQLSELLASENTYCRLAAARIEANQLPPGFDMDSHIIR